ncbi:uncharacterized protein LOC135145902 [Zophobas morio]|uniref:uncharacterized protein LOC135145902 n=1 Tax=Zophobas morio TaxID=2755281 RepID=UPI0030839B9B
MEGSWLQITTAGVVKGVVGNSHGNATQGLGKLKTADFSRHSLKGHHRLVTRHQVAKDTCNSSVMLPFIKELQSYLSKVFSSKNFKRLLSVSDHINRASNLFNTRKEKPDIQKQKKTAAGFNLLSVYFSEGLVQDVWLSIFSPPLSG